MNMHELFRRHDDDRLKCGDRNRPVTLTDLHEAEVRIEALLLALFVELTKDTEKKKKQVVFNYSLGLPENKQTTGQHMLELTITNEQQVRVTLTPVTATGKPAKLDGAPTWTVVTGNSSVSPADDGLSAILVSADDPGDTQFLVKADADLGSGVEEVSDVIKLTVEGARATSLGLSAEAPTPKP